MLILTKCNRCKAGMWEDEQKYYCACGPVCPTCAGTRDPEVTEVTCRHCAFGEHLRSFAFAMARAQAASVLRGGR